MTVSDWLREARERLAVAGIDAPHLEAQVLAGHVLLVNRAWLLTHPEAEFPELAGEGVLQRRLAHEPLAYILGYREFYGRRFSVSPAVLIPRQDTETLIELGLSALDRNLSNAPRVLDLCTGSGCIGITMKCQRPAISATLTDISASALEVAQENAASLKADVSLVQGDLFEPITSTFDLILCNPPYIGRDEQLSAEVSQYEPETALYADNTGLSIFEELAAKSQQFLGPGGVLLMEVGYQQSAAVKSLFQNAGWLFLATYPDLSGIERVVGASVSEGSLP